jgi:hypothetical protein
MDVAVAPETAPSSGDRTCDTVIIGAGLHQFAGLMYVTLTN